MSSITIDLDNIDIHGMTSSFNITQLNLTPQLTQEQRLTKFMLWYRILDAIIRTGDQEHSGDWDPIFYIHSHKVGKLPDMESVTVEGHWERSGFYEEKNANVKLHLETWEGTITIIPLSEVKSIQVDFQ